MKTQHDSAARRGLLRRAVAGTAVLLVAATVAFVPDVTAVALQPPMTASISPSNARALVPSTYTETYRANTVVKNGTVRSVIPSGWTTPQSAAPGGAGYVSVSRGTCTAVGTTPSLTPLAGGATQITINGVTCATSASLTLTYAMADPVKAGRYLFGPTSVQPNPTAGVVTVASPTLTATTGPTTHFVVTATPHAVTAGSSLVFTVTPEDASGETSSYNGAIGFSSSDHGASTVLPRPTTISAAHSFSATLTTAGMQTITVTDTKAVPTVAGTLSGLTVNPAATTLLTWSAVTPVNSVTPAGQYPMGDQLRYALTAMDRFHNVTPAYAGRVRTTSGTDSTAVLPSAYTFVPATDHGSHNFTLTPMTVGNETYAAADSSNAAIRGTTTVPVGLGLSPEATSDLTGAVGVPLSQRFSASGATGTVKWSAAALPSWLSLDGTTGMLSGTPTSAGTVGPFTITATDSASPAHTGSWQYSVAVGQGTQSVAFSSTAPVAPFYGGPEYAPKASASSGLTVVFRIDPSTSAVCAITDGVVSFTDVGTCTVDADQGGDADYLAAPTVSQSFTVVGATQSVAFTTTAPSDAVVNGTTYLPAATATSGLPVTFLVDDTSTGVCSIADGVVSFDTIGTCTIDSVQGGTTDAAGNADWLAAPSVSQSFAVAGMPQTIAFTSDAPTDAMVGGSAYTPTASASSGLTPVTFAIDASSTSDCELANDGSISFHNVGTCVIDAGQAGSDTFAPAPEALQSFDVAASAVIIDFTSSAPSGAVIGGGSYAPTTAVSTGVDHVTLGVDSSSTAVCSISDGIVSFIGSGTCTIDANQGAGGGYPAAAEVQQSFTVSTPVAPVPAITIDATGDTQIPTIPPNPGVNNCPAQQFPDGGCVIDDLDGTVDNTFDASATSDPNPNPSQDTVTYHWQIFYPPIFGPSVVFTDDGITGYQSPVLHITAGSLPELASDSRTSGDPFWRAELTTTVNGVSSTSVFFRFIYDSSFSLDFSTDCLLSGEFASFDCAIVAPQLLPAGNQGLYFTSTAPTDAVLGGPAYVPTTTSLSGRPVTLTIDSASTNVCALDSSGTSVSLIGPGTCTIDASQTAVGQWESGGWFADNRQQTFQVAG